MSDASWPYPDWVPDEDELESKPTWDCPGGLCECHPRREIEATFEHRIVLFDHEAKRIPNARCRIFENGRLIKEVDKANGSGAVDLLLLEDTKTLLLEWAPAHLPQGHRYPYRRIYRVEVGTGEQGVRHRLDNMGFDLFGELPSDVELYDAEYGDPRYRPTRDWQDIQERLAGDHDRGELQPLTGRSNLLARDDARSGSPRPPPSQIRLTSKPFIGAAAVVKINAITVELAMAFSLFKSDFTPVDGLKAVHNGNLPESAKPLSKTKGKKQAPRNVFEYDVEAIAAHNLGPSGFRIFRYATAKGAHRVIGARLSLSGPGVFLERPSNGVGRTVFIFKDKLPAPLDLRIEVEPKQGQFTPNNLPAGAGITNSQTTASHMFRAFALTLTVDKNGDVDKKTVKVELNPADVKPIYARDVTRNTRAAANHLIIDWRPDWIALPKKKREIPRPDPNALDPELTAEQANKLAKPPAWVNHEPENVLIGGTIAHFANQSVPESAHYVIDLDGFVVKMVDETYRASHAGHSIWDNVARVNDFAVGVEIVHNDVNSLKQYRPNRYTEEQYQAVMRLISDAKIIRRRVLGHADIRVVQADDKGLNGRLSVDKKFCPGEMFEWERLEHAGLALKFHTDEWEQKMAGKADRVIPFSKFGHSQADKDTIKKVKRQLFDIGYSVTSKLVTNPDDPKQIDEKYSRSLFHAIRAFQTRYFTGSRQYAFDATKPPGKQISKRYDMFGTKSNIPSRRRVGTLDTATEIAIEVVHAHRND